MELCPNPELEKNGLKPVDNPLAELPKPSVELPNPNAGEELAPIWHAVLCEKGEVSLLELVSWDPNTNPGLPPPPDVSEAPKPKISVVPLDDSGAVVLVIPKDVPLTGSDPKSLDPDFTAAEMGVDESATADPN